MRLVREVRQVGTAEPVGGSDITVQKWPALTLVSQAETSPDGMVEIVAQGSPGPVRVRSERGAALYDEYTSNIAPVGLFDLGDLLTRLGGVVPSGVVAHYGNVFRATVGSGNLTLASGGVVIGGVLALFPSPTTLAVTNGDRAAVAVLSGEAVSLAEIAYSAINAAIHVPLYRYTVSGGNVQSSTITNIARLAGPRRGSKTIFGVAATSSGSTLSAGGEAAGLELTLALESGLTYDIFAKGSVVGSGYDGAIAVEVDGSLGSYKSLNGDVAGRVGNSHNKAGVSGASALIKLYDRRDTSASTSQWTLQDTYGSTGSGNDNFDTPGQVASDGTHLYVADTANNRIIKRLISTGAFVTAFDVSSIVTGPIGVAVDLNGDIWVSGILTGSTNAGLARFSSAGVIEQHMAITTGGSAGHVAVDASRAYYVSPSHHIVRSVNLAFGSGVTWGSAGSGDGQFNTPWGIAYNPIDGLLYVVDTNNFRVQVLTTAGVYQRQWSLGGMLTLPIAVMSSGNLVVGSFGLDAVVQYSPVGVLIDTFLQNNPSGIAVSLGNVVWVSSTADDTIAKWDEVVSNTPFSWQAGLLTAMAIPRG